MMADEYSFYDFINAILLFSENMNFITRVDYIHREVKSRN